jgi:hypothetical protein
MPGEALLELLDKKYHIIEEVLMKTSEQNRLIINKEFNAVADVDAVKQNLIKELINTDSGIAEIKATDVKTYEKAKDKIQNINLSLNHLIKLEKENEILLEQAKSSFSGEYIKAYKTYKQP